MISLIVPAYNVAHVLPLTVPATLNQAGPDEWIYVDDGSTDETHLVLESLIAGQGDVGTRDIRIIRHLQNRGRAAARNSGIAEARGDILVFLDADVAPQKGYVHVLQAALDEKHTVASVGRLQVANQDLSEPYQRYLSSSLRGIQRHRPGEPIPWKHLLFGICAIRRTALDTVGLLDDSLTYGEDLELAGRLSGISPDGLQYAPDAKALHYDIGDLAIALKKMIEFGRDNLPAMVAEYPELARWTGVDVVHSPAGNSVRRAAARLFLRPGLAKATHRMLPYLPSGVSDYAVRYLLGYTLATSYQEGMRALSTR